MCIQMGLQGDPIVKEQRAYGALHRELIHVAVGGCSHGDKSNGDTARSATLRSYQYNVVTARALSPRRQAAQCP